MKVFFYFIDDWKMILIYCRKLASNWRFAFIVLAVVFVILNTLSSKQFIQQFSSSTATYSNERKRYSDLNLRMNSTIDNFHINVGRTSLAKKSHGMTNFLDVKTISCKKQENIIFVKVHKTGSTTAWGIFARFVKANNLNMVLPKYENGPQFNYLSTKYKKFNETIMKLPKNVSYNILCNHAVYDKKEFQKIMPKDTVRTGILRDPLSVFTSAFFYFGFYKHLRRRHPNITKNLLLHKFLDNGLYLRYGLHTYLRNSMAYDFGIPTSKMSNNSFVRDYIKQLDRDFSIILITEYFDESLVLMKRYFCWDLEDIIYLPVNKGKWRSRVDPYLTHKDKMIIKNLNSADYMLYGHFKDKLLKQINQEDVTFPAEVKHFKDIINRFSEFCFHKEQNKSSFIVFEKSPWNSEFTLKGNKCFQVIVQELNALRQLIKQAKERFTTNHNSKFSL